ncbi:MULTISPECIES: ABC transporter permease [Atopobiaceae]|uniref:Nucleoside ABC transporter membrane protein n=1 Tax=Parafannyhessea umbonata TaxID=604330 RepID=A0A1H9QT74_9ACTN|nr:MULTISPECIES: ABC transporter permease [Atopobiaceae]SEH44478.1 nucleoside ABC transporter membrane protein [Parafannyhessea umbonata]SER63666.1 nucleoside ABC transporter membrane protein [Parafannyhessea umbonata]SJZ60274.1 simple sugar transport system permease protein [Olsenella sp. KH1P3]
MAKKELSAEERSEKRLMILTPIVSVLLALIVGAIIIAVLGKDPIQGYAAMLRGSLGDPAKIAKTLERACPLVFTGLCAVFAYKCGVFNLGGEGQFIMGGCATATVMFGLGLQGPVGLALGLIVGMVVGGIWGLLPGIMKITRGLNEMITTIMLNYVALYFMEYVFKNLYSDSGLPKTLAIPQSARLPQIANAHVGVLVAILLGVFIWYLIFRTSFGFKIRAVGMNPVASKVNGFPVKRLVLLAFIISGAIAGLGGAIELLGRTPFRLADGFGSGFGFDGVAIALIAQLNPIAAIFVALLFGVLSTGGTMMQSVIGVPTAIVEIVRGLIIIFAVAGMAAVKLPKIRAFFAARQNAKVKKAEVNA